MLKKSIICATMIGIVAIALASTGGGKKKSSPSIPTPAFTPRSAGIFTLKSKPEYSGSLLLKTIGQRNSVVYKSVVTYQKGNTIYVVPNQYRMSSQPKLTFKSNASRSNLSVVDLKLRLCK